MTTTPERNPVAPRTRLAIVTGSPATVALPAHVIRQRAAAVDFDVVTRKERWELVRGLLRALHAGPIGSGLAAPMTGIGLRVVVSTAGGELRVMFNPEIVDTRGPEEVAPEGNLCLPGVEASVTRPHTATVQWQSINSGRHETATFEGWEARVLMHEIEILDGTLFVDHAESPPTDGWLPAEERARRAASIALGESPAAWPGSEPLGLAILPPSLRSLDGVLTRPAVELDLQAVERTHVRALIESMLRVQFDRRGVGLAAPQVGLSLRLVVIDSGQDRPLVLINPRILDRDEHEEVASEGCLSIPGWHGDVSRSTRVKVATDTTDGEVVEKVFSGYLARIAQHEIDHIDGVLFTDRVAPDAKLSVTDPDLVADEMLRILERREARASRESADSARAPKKDGRRKAKRRR
ncbi:MAG TPA: peptide deformylase [Thermoleophilaceae bacterium]|nr:peptide deformylase [Thermoleophilaceae bacterium]